MQGWHKLVAYSSLVENTLCPVVWQSQSYVLIKQKNQVSCFLDKCSHQDIKLSDFGEVINNSIVCHAHGARFHCQKGEAICGPTKRPLEQIIIKVFDNWVWIKNQNGVSIHG